MKKCLFLLSILSITATRAAAHEGPRVWIDIVNGTVTTFTSDNDLDPTAYAPSRLFTAVLDPVLGVYTTDFPGYEVKRSGANVPLGTTFGFNITGPLLYFDEASGSFVSVQAEFGPPQPGPVPQLAVSLSASFIVTGDGPVGGFDFYAFNAPGDHSHLTYTFLGDGSAPVDGPSGIYALPLSLTSSGLAASDTFYLLVGKDVDDEDPLFETALAVAQATLVSNSVAGDMNCSGAMDGGDVADFIQALLDPAGYTAMHPSCDILHGDLNGDGLVDGADIQQFVALLLN